MALPTCETGCNTSVPAALFNECQPEVNAAEISKIYLTQKGNPLADWTDSSEWTSRLMTYDASASSYADDAILELTVLGDKPAPTMNEVPVSGDRTVSFNNEHVVNFTIDETNAVNREWARQMQCNGGNQYLAYFTTSGGIMFGGENGTDGIPANVKVHTEIVRDRNDIIRINGTLTWKATFDPESITSPIS